jgi:Zn-dependent M28 family amino/carboxypeptidase
MKHIAARLALILFVSVVACSSKPPSAADGDGGRSSAATLQPSNFDGDKAFEHVRKLVEMGPRPVGSEAITQARDYIIAELKKYNLGVTKDEFVAETPLGQKPMVNIIGELKGQSDNIIMLGSHYDTKLFNDITFVGANDGGSSTGALLEVARVLAASEQKLKHTLWFVFFDGEEAFVNWTQKDSKYGSRHLAEKLEKDEMLPKVKALVLLDMIGDKDLDLSQDGYSTKWLVDVIWATARELGYEKIFLDRHTLIDDDHYSFLQKGVAAVDLIDFNYGTFNRFWHTANDTLDKLSPKSLKIIGDTVIRALPKIETTLGESGKAK